ncbi:MAG: DUF1549 domain-containing protein [Aureliella sp.]
MLRRRAFACYGLVCCLWLAALGSSARSQESSDASPADPWQNLPLGLDATRVIDLAIEAGWRAHELEPVAPADDATFLRRIYLDLLGRIPLQSEQQEFLAQADSRKRETLVDRLLASDEHAEHFAEVYDAILIGRTEVDQFRRRSDAGWLEYLKRAVRENRPWDQVAREILLARPQSDQERGATWYLAARKNRPQDMAEAVSKDFFGVRIDCAQCHDHPLAAEIEQRHYWGLVAFFNRTKNVDSPRGPRLAESAIGGFSNFSNLEGEAKPNELVYLGDRRVEEARPAADAKETDSDDLYLPAADGEPRVPKFSRREQFVDKVLKDHPLLAQAMVNRMWGWMLGRGLVHPVDALDSFHPASHPGLLDWLSRDFAASGYDVRRLVRSLALSRAYQLTSSRDAFADPQWFSSALTKPLTAEALHRSLLVALDPEDIGRWNSVDQRIAFAKQFPDVLAEETLATVSQGLLLTNGEAINQIVSAKESRLVRALVENRDDAVVIQRLFQAVYGRQPDAQEQAQCVAYLADHSAADHNAADHSAAEASGVSSSEAASTEAGGSDTAGSPESSAARGRAIEGLAWALVTSAEFRFNH